VFSHNNGQRRSLSPQQRLSKIPSPATFHPSAAAIVTTKLAPN
jgi:hypothetical protein